MDPPDPTWESFEILLLHVLSNDAWQFTINFFPSAEGHLKMLIYFFCIENASAEGKSISQFKIVGPPWPKMKCFEILLLHVLSNDAWQFTINLFSSAEGHWKMLIYHLKWSDCNALNIAGNCIKDINVNLSFLSLGSKVVEWTPLTQHENFWNSTFACTVQWCMHNLP